MIVRTPSEGDCRVLLGRYFDARSKENSYRGDPCDATADRLMAASAKAEKHCIMAMLGEELPAGWHNGTDKPPPEPDKVEYAGLAEAAEMFGFTKQVISNWRRRGDMPEPFAELKMGPVWKTETLIEWGTRRSLLPKEDIPKRVRKPTIRVHAVIPPKSKG